MENIGMAQVMIVDDAAFTRLMLRDIFAANGIEVVAEASNGVEAVLLFKKLRPDLVIMDISMPEMDGLAALVRIRKIDLHAKVVMCTALEQHSMVLDAIKAGAKDFIVKPFNKDRIVETIHRFLHVHSV
jgi:two-component system chemotaxis response regulator CheY